MPPITWRNVQAGNTASSVDAFSRAGEQLGRAVKGVGGALKQGTEDYVERETEQFISDLNNAPDEATRQQMIQQASNAFLDMGDITKAQQDMVLQDRARTRFDWDTAAEARDVTRFGQTTEAHDSAMKRAGQAFKHAAAAEGRTVESHAADRSRWADADRDRDLAHTDALRESGLGAKYDADIALAAQEERTRKRTGNQRIDDARDLTAQALANVNQANTASERYQLLTDHAANLRKRGLQMSKAQKAEFDQEVGLSISRMSAVDVPTLTADPTMLIKVTGKYNGLKKIGDTGQIDATALDSFEAGVISDIKKAMPHLSDENAKALATKVFLTQDGYIKQREQADDLKTNRTTRRQIQLDKDKTREELITGLEADTSVTGIAGTLRKHLQDNRSSEFGPDAFGTSDLMEDISSMVLGIKRVRPKISDRDLAKVVAQFTEESYKDTGVTAGIGWDDIAIRFAGEKYEWKDFETYDYATDDRLRTAVGKILGKKN